MNRPAGKIISSLTNDVESVNNLVSNAIIKLIGDLLTVIVTITSLLIISWELTFFILGFAPLIGGILYVFAKKSREYWRKTRRTISLITSLLQESISGSKTIKAFVNETLESFKKYSPNITVRLFKVIKTEAECEAEVYLYKGDKWGNKELVAYYLEKKTINFFVLSARTEFAFNKATQPFLDLAKSYVFITDQVQIEESKE